MPDEKRKCLIYDSCATFNLCLAVCNLVPLVLTHVAVPQDAVLKSADEIPVSCSTNTAASPSLICRVRVSIAIGRRRVVSRAWLQPNRRIGIQMAGNSLDSGWNPLRIHG